MGAGYRSFSESGFHAGFHTGFYAVPHASAWVGFFRYVHVCDVDPLQTDPP